MAKIDVFKAANTTGIAISNEEYNSLCERMADCVNLDTEEGHITADHILVEALEKMGYKQLTDIYLNLNKWYS